jgi:gamma-glutamylcysteine synthetase
VDNTIGGTPQPNGWEDDWVNFFREKRLRHMLKLAGACACVWRVVLACVAGYTGPIPHCVCHSMYR